DGAAPHLYRFVVSRGSGTTVRDQPLFLSFPPALGMTPASFRIRSLIMSASREAVSANLDRGSSVGPGLVARCPADCLGGVERQALPTCAMRGGGGGTPWRGSLCPPVATSNGGGRARCRPHRCHGPHPAP